MAKQHDSKLKANPLGAIGRKPGSYVGDFDRLLSEVSDSPTPSPKIESSAVPVEKGSQPEGKPPTKRVNLDVPTELHQRFKGATSMAGRTMTDVIQELMREYLNRSV